MLVYEWCSNCSTEIEVQHLNEYHECYYCGDKVAPCNSYAHSEVEAEKHEIEMCICMEVDK